MRNFLLAIALFWLREFHVDGLRVDAVASMLYLDYSRREGEWVPNAFGGREDLDAVSFLKELNEVVHGREPGVISAAEESTAWPGVSRPTYLGGLGFGFKWNMGWMHDTLDYFRRDPIHRRYHHHQLTFSLMYAFSENFILPLSHDEVVHGKGSLLSKMPGDRWQQFANLRALYAYMWAHPGKKLLFMGGELAQEREWTHDRSLDWHLLEQPEHAGMQQLVRDLNRALPRAARALGGRLRAGRLPLARAERRGAQRARLRALRRSTATPPLVCVCNLSPEVREGYRVGFPAGGRWREVLNTDSTYYGGSDVGNLGGVEAEPDGWHDQPFSAELTLPPLSVVLVRARDARVTSRRVLGAVPRDEEVVDFEVWAPAASSLAVRVNGDEHALEPRRGGLLARRGAGAARRRLLVSSSTARRGPTLLALAAGGRARPVARPRHGAFDWSRRRRPSRSTSSCSTSCTSARSPQEGTFDAAIPHLRALASSA